MLKIDNLIVSYGSIKALHRISFEVKQGEIVTLIGSNGAGKSTTLNTIAGVVTQKSGTITFKEEDISHMPARQRVKAGIVLCPEGRQVFPHMTVEGNLEMGAFVEKDKQKILDQFAFSYELFPILAERKNQVAGTLSGGEQQMLSIARALMSSPKMLMLDEPSLGLAPVLVEQIFELIQKINKTGTTILLVEQNALAALQIADRGYVLETGNVVLSGKGSDLMLNNSVIESYLGG